MLRLLIRRHKAKISNWKARFSLNDYQVFWMGFGEGLLIGGVLGIGITWLYLTG